MLKWIGATVLVALAIGLPLGCARGPAATTAMVAPQTYTVAPVPAEITSGEATVLWHDIGIYRVSGPQRLAGPTYAVTSYETKAACEAAQQTAMAKEALSRLGPTAERLSDGVKTWDSDRQHYTTFRYFCELGGTGPAPFR